MQTTRQCSAAAVEVSVCGPQQPAQSKLTRCSSSLSLYGNHRGWHVWDASWQHGHCSRRHLASLHLVAELSRSPLARTPQTQAQLLFAADCSQLGSLVLPALAALPRLTSHPSLAGPFPIRKSTSDMFNTNIKRQIRPTEEKTLPQVTAPWTIQA